jgi:hypothetical protein
VFVRGAFVHHRSGGVIRRATKTGGALEETSVAGVDQLAFDESGFCWCSIDKEPKVFCRGADDASRPLQLEAKSKCDWIAISRANVVIQAGAALWVAGRP